MEPQNFNSAPSFDEGAVCDRCGKFGAYAFEGRTLCTDCYAQSCSCCPEFGADDLSRPQKSAERRNE